LVAVPSQRNSQKAIRRSTRIACRKVEMKTPPIAAEGFGYKISWKYGINHYRKNNNLFIDVEHWFIRRYPVSSAKISYDCKVLPMLPDPENPDN
jgi:hypothetical protein